MKLCWRFIICVLLSWCVSGCSEVPATNPFDPAAPTAQQEKATVSGVVILPAGFGRSLLEEGAVEMVALNDPSVPAYTTSLLAVDTMDDDDMRARGRFIFEEVSAGIYQVRPRVRGLSPKQDQVLTLTVEIGRAVNDYTIELVAPSADSAGGQTFIEGTANLGGEGILDHSGIVVEGENTPFTAITNQDGKFRLAVVAGTYSIRLSYRGYDSETRDNLEVEPGKTTRIDETVVLRGQPGQLTGSFSLGENQSADTLMNVQVTATPLGMTDAEPRVAALTYDGQQTVGQFIFDALPIGEYTIEFAVGGFHPETRTAAIAPGARVGLQPVTLRPLPSSATIQGKAQLSGTMVHTDIVIELVGGTDRAVTNEAGEFSLAVPAGQASYTIRARKAGYGTEITEIPAFDDKVVLDDPIVLVGLPGQISGSFALAPAQQSPDVLRNVQVTAISTSAPNAEPAVAALTYDQQQTQGQFIFENLAIGEYTVQFSVGGFFPEVRGAIVTPGATSSMDHVVLNPRPSSAVIAGIAQVSGAVDHSEIAIELVGTAEQTVTNSEGQFSLSVPAGRPSYTVRARKAGFGPQTVDVPAFDEIYTIEDPIVITGLPGSIEGAVQIDAEFGNDRLANVEVILKVIDGEEVTVVQRKAPNQAGVFLFDGVTAGSYVLEVTLPGFFPAFRAPVVDAGATVNAGLIRLSPVAAQAVFRGSAKLPCPPGALCDNSGIVIQTLGAPYTTVTNEEGNYQLDVIEGEYQIKATRRGFSATTIGPYTIDADELKDDIDPIIMDFLAAGVSGVVQRMGPDGTPVPALGATVTLLTNPPVNTVTNADGGFSLGGVQEGPYKLRVDLDRHVSFEKPVRLIAGEILDAGDMVVDVHRGTLHGTAARGDALGQGGVTVVARRTADDLFAEVVERVVVSTNLDDRWSLAGLPVGNWVISARADGYRPFGPQSIQIEHNGITERVISLARRVHRIDVPALVSDNAITATFTADDDLTYYQVWVGQQPAVDDWQPLPDDGRVSLDAPFGLSGHYVVYGRLATDAYVNDGADVSRAVSPVLSTDVLFDDEAPIIGSIRVGDGSGYLRDAGGDVDVQVQCIDVLHPSTELNVRIEVDGQLRFDGPYQPIIPVNVGAVEGEKRLAVTCTDPAGNADTAPEYTLIHDVSAPQVTGFQVDSGSGQMATASRDVALNIVVTDALSGVESVAVAEGAIDCASADYRPIGVQTSFQLSATNEVKQLLLCARDRAGNVTNPIPADNTVLLDTVAPTAPTGSLGDGSGWSVQARVALNLATTDDDPSGYTVYVSGDVANPVPPSPWNERPATIELSPGLGPKTISVWVADAAGNRSLTTHVSISVDNTAPQVFFVNVGNGTGYVKDEQGSTFIQLGCVDDEASDEDLTLRITSSRAGHGDVLLYDGSYRPLFGLELGDEQGKRTLQVRCTNKVDLSDTYDPIEVTVDYTPPTIGSFTLNGGGANELTNLLNVQARMTASDVHTGVQNLAIFESSAINCKDAAFNYDDIQEKQHPLTIGDGPRTLYLCAKDRAGNISSRVESNAVLVDTTPPDPGSVTLAGGAAKTSDSTISINFSSSEQGVALELSGDVLIRGEGIYRSDEYPEQVTLTVGNAEKTVTARFRDAAGNYSAPFSAVIELDQNGPSVRNVTIGGGEAIVYQQIVPINIEIGRESPYTMQFWERNGPRCTDKACDDPGYVNFNVASSMTLSANFGPKVICYQFCDEAGNYSDHEEATILYAQGRPRPRMISQGRSETALRPDQHFAGSYNEDERPTVTIHGEAISMDTYVTMGDFQVPCIEFRRDDVTIFPIDDGRDPNGAAGEAGFECRADDSANTCADECIVRLPSAMLRNPGTYLTRLVTPDPVVDGQNQSAEAFYFSMVAPLPEILSLSNHGVTGDVESFTVVVTARNVMDNATFQIGPNIGTVLSRLPVEEDEAEGRDNEERNDRQRGRDEPQLPNAVVDYEYVVSFESAGLDAIDGVDYELLVRNPAPGGGEATRPFGFNPVSVLCDGAEGCTSSLGYTRADILTPQVHGELQRYTIPSNRLSGGPLWSGGTAASVYTQGASQFATRIRKEWLGGVLPWTSAGVSQVQVEDGLRQGAQVRLRGHVDGGFRRGRGDGTFDDPIITALGGDDPVALAIGDLNHDGLPDLVTAHARSDEIQITFGHPTLMFDGGSSVRYATGTEPEGLSLADVNGDGYLDVVTANRRSNSVSIRLGHGDGQLDARRDLETRTGPHQVLVADVTHDGLPDIVVAHCQSDNFDTRTCRSSIGNGNELGDAGLTVFAGNGLAGFGQPEFYPVARSPEHVAVADMNDDGYLDVVIAPTDPLNNMFVDFPLEYRLGQKDGTWSAPIVLANTNVREPTKVAVVDMNADGLNDIVASASGNNVVWPILRQPDGSYDSDTGSIVSSKPEDFSIGDVNGDGWPDMLAFYKQSNQNNPKLSVTMNTGDGTLATPNMAGLFTDYAMNSGPYPETGMLYDVNGDGALDMIAIQKDDGTAGPAQALTYLGRPAKSVGHHASFTHPDLRTPRAVAAGDFNADGSGDFVSLPLAGTQLIYWMGQENGAYHAPVALDNFAPAKVRAVAVGRLRSNGNENDVVLATDTGKALIYYGVPNGIFGPAEVDFDGGLLTDIVVADKTNDGHQDIFVLDYTNGQVRFAEGAGDGTVGSVRSYSSGAAPTALAVVDLNDDNLAEFIVVRETAHVVSVRRGWTGTTMLNATEYTMAGNPNSVAVGDLDNDGELDVITGHWVSQFQHAGNHPYFDTSDPNIGVSFRLGNANWTLKAAEDQLMHLGIEQTVTGVAVTDINGDGLDDLLLTNYEDDTITVMIGPFAQDANGDDPQRWAPMARYEIGVGRTPFKIALSSANSDGSMDLFVSAQASDAISRWRTPAPGSWNEELIFDASAPSISGRQTEQYVLPNALRYVERANARVRVQAGEQGATVTGRFVGPNGSGVTVFSDRVIPAGTAYQGYFLDGTPRGPNMGQLEGWQRGGEYRFEFTVSAGTADLEEAALILRSQFNRP